MTHEKAKIDFSKVENLRRHMLLTVENMAAIFGVSRETYYNWKRGYYPRVQKEIDVRNKIRALLFVLTDLSWPTPDVIAADQKDRYLKLLAVLPSEE
jgi:DNA-binding XRE family transcriptional regulator